MSTTLRKQNPEYTAGDDSNPAKEIIWLLEDDGAEPDELQQAFLSSAFHCPVKKVRNVSRMLKRLPQAGQHGGRRARQLPLVVIININKLPEKDIATLKKMKARGRLRMLPMVIISDMPPSANNNTQSITGPNTYTINPKQPKDVVDICQLFKGYWQGVVNEIGRTLPGATAVNP